jgi:hypothetical protein
LAPCREIGLGCSALALQISQKSELIQKFQKQLRTVAVGHATQKSTTMRENAFEEPTFRLLANYTYELLKYKSLANDCGLDPTTNSTFQYLCG